MENLSKDIIIINLKNAKQLEDPILIKSVHFHLSGMNKTTVVVPLIPKIHHSGGVRQWLIDLETMLRTKINMDIATNPVHIIQRVVLRIVSLNGSR